MKKDCPRCHKTFECRRDDILNCDCMWVCLNGEARRYLHLRYPEQCLCMDCLNKISKIYNVVSQFNG